MERFSRIVLVAGLCCFGMAVFLVGYLPAKHLSRLEFKTLEEMALAPSETFVSLSRRFPEQFGKYYGEPNAENFYKALRLGRDTYIAEACWHCHSQFVRPVSNENVRFGKVSWADEYMNEMFLPHLFGTRRIGPDLIREAGKHGDDWHLAHFFDPTIVVPVSVMPRYPWFYDGEKPNDRGIAIVTYVQWLGSWAEPEALARVEVIPEESDEDDEDDEE